MFMSLLGDKKHLNLRILSSSSFLIIMPSNKCPFFHRVASRLSPHWPLSSEHNLFGYCLFQGMPQRVTQLWLSQDKEKSNFTSLHVCSILPGVTCDPAGDGKPCHIADTRTTCSVFVTVFLTSLCFSTQRLRGYFCFCYI